MKNQEIDKALAGKSDSIKKSSDNTSGIGGLTTFAILLVIGGIATTGFLYKKAGGDFNEMVKLSRTFYYDVTDLITENYISFINNEIDGTSDVEYNQNTAPAATDTSTKIAQTEAQLTQTDEADLADVDNNLTDTSSAIVEADKETQIPETNSIAIIEEEEVVAVVAESQETRPAEITAAKAESDISNDKNSQNIPPETEVAKTASEDNSSINHAIAQQVKVAPVPEAMAIQSTTAKKPAYASGRFNHPGRYSQPANPFYLQQRIFEQNRRYQQQMMSQALKMQTALLKEAEMRHQQMLRRAADWKLQVQQRRQETQNRFYQPTYMN